MTFIADKTHCSPEIAKELDNLSITLIRDYQEETIFTCKYCGQSYDEGGALEHTKHCIANYHCHKNCLTCNNYEIHKYQTGSKTENDYKTELVTMLAGSNNNKFYCSKKEIYLLDEDYDITKDRKDCYTAPKDEVKYIEMPCYKEQWEAINDDLAKDPDNFIDEEAKQRYQDTKEQ